MNTVSSAVAEPGPVASPSPSQTTQSSGKAPAYSGTPSPVPSSAPVPAPVPAVNAWNKPINFNGNSTPGQNIGEPRGFDKGDQHDSGIDVSDPPNSAGSSQRSSPSAENKIKDDLRKVS